MNSTLIKISYKELLERYNILLRKASLIHPLILKKFENEYNAIVEKIENLVSEDSCSDDKTFILNLRRLICKLENVLIIDVTSEYNKYVTASFTSSYDDTLIISKEIVLNNQNIQTEYPNVVWEKVQGFLKQRLNIHTYNVWVKPIKFHSCSENVINIAVQNSYFKNWLEEHCASMIKDHLGELNLEYDVKFITA